MKNYIVLVLFILAGSFKVMAQVSQEELKEFHKEIITPSELEKNWDFYGIGKAFSEVHNQFLIGEDEKSLGAILVSPKSYGENVVIRYEAMTLTPASVLVAILSATNHGKDTPLTIPEDHNGAMPFWRDEVDCYFFAFSNAAHNFTPFVRRYPKTENSTLASAKENVMQAGRYYKIEVGRIGKKLWLKVDGKLMFKTEDYDPLPGGKIAFRTRGTAGYKAAFLMKNLEIYTK